MHDKENLDLLKNPNPIEEEKTDNLKQKETITEKIAWTLLLHWCEMVINTRNKAC